MNWIWKMNFTDILTWMLKIERFFNEPRFSIFVSLFLPKYKLVKFVNISTFSIFCKKKKNKNIINVNILYRRNWSWNFFKLTRILLSPNSRSSKLCRFSRFSIFEILLELRNNFFNLVKLFSPCISVILLNAKSNILKNETVVLISWGT